MAQDEALRVVDFTRMGGRPFGVLNLEDGTFYSKVKGTLAVVPGERATTMARQPGRYGGSRAADDRKENAALQWTAMVIGATEDDALSKAGALLSELEDLVVGRKIEFRARGATYPTYLDVRGPGTATPAYDPELLTQQNAFPVELSVPVAPLGELPQTDIRDDFSVDSTSDYSFDAGATGDVLVGAGALSPGGNLLANPSFESGGTAGWVIDDAVNWTGTTFATTAAWSTDGPNACRVAGTKDNTATGRKLGALTVGGGVAGIPVLPNTSYTFRADVNLIDAPNPAGDDRARINVEWWDVAGVSLGESQVDERFGVANGIYDLAGSVTSPAGAAFMRVEVHILSTVALDTVDLYIDNVRAYRTAAGTTLALTADHRARHTARGYRWREHQRTQKFTPGATITGFKGGVTLRASANTYVEVYVDDDGVNSRLRTDVVLAGVRTNRASVNLAARVVNATPFWVRGRIEGNVVYAEHFTSAPTPMGAPTTVAPAGGAGYTLAAGEITALVAGNGGWSWTPQHASATMDDYADEPFTRRNATLPAQVSPADQIPGDAPALADVVVTPSGGSAAPVWAMVGWTPRPGTPIASHVVPFGLIQAEAADALTTWATAADANYRNGNGIKVTTAGAGTASAEWRIDPSTLTPDPFSVLELDLELFVRVELASTLVSPRLTLSAKPDAGTTFGAERFSSPFESSGKLLVKPASGTAFRLVRLGVVTVVADPRNQAKWRLRLAGAWLAGSTGVFGADELVVSVARARAAGPTGRANDASYPKFVGSTSPTQKTIRSDLSGLSASPPDPGFPDSGLGGEPIELPAGLADVLVKLSSLVPDDPTSDATSEQKEHSATVHLALTPRTNLLRGV